MGRARNERLLRSLSLPDLKEALSLDRRGGHTPETWFLGPKAENADILEGLVVRALRHNFASRRAYMPSDPRIFPDGQTFEEAERFLSGCLDDLMHWLRGSVPLSSHRNLSHMYWDQSLPAVVGYIAALLYNQNNVAAEASPATTLLEMEVGDDLCRMLGYRLPTEAEIADGRLKPWGHITCDGSVANGESVWASRNLKYVAVALAEAVRSEPDLAAARHLSVRRHDGRRARLLEMDGWDLLNLPIDEAVGLGARLTTAAGIDPSAVEAALGLHSVQALGLVSFHQRYLPECPPPVLLAPQTAHYSWPKFMALCGLGRESLRAIPVDLDGRMNTVALRGELDRCLAERQPVMQVTAVLGTTEESAVDPLREIIAIRDEYRALGLEFSVHADAAWGGYFAALLREPKGRREERPARAGHRTLWSPVGGGGDVDRGIEVRDGEADPGIVFSDYVRRQFTGLPQADTITVDPHKAGFVPYPAGALCYRNGGMRELISFKAPVVYHGGVDPTVGVYGIEGSKPGAAAAAVYLSHRVIRTDKSGYGDLLARCIFNSKRFYAALVNLSGPDFAVTPFQRLPSEKVPGATAEDVAAELSLIDRRITCLEDADLVEALKADRQLLQLFQDLGPDLTITTYAFNLVTAAGRNTDAGLMNEMNDLIYRKLSLQAFDGGTVPTTPMFVTSSAFDPQSYGQDFVDVFARRAGVVPQPGLAMSFLISTVQNPWLSEAGSTSMLRTLMSVLGQTASAAAQAVMARHGLAPPGSA